MTITDPEILARAHEGLKKKKANFDANKGVKVRRMVNILVCRVCKSSIGTFGRVKKTGKMIHLNCPGPQSEESIATKVKNAMFGDEK